MFGHMERPVHWARHLLRIRALQAETGGFTEFVPLPFVHMEAPIYLQGQSAARTDIPRGRADARGGAAGAAPAYPEHPGVVGEDGPGRRSGVSARGRQRSRRNADGRDHLARGRRIARPGDDASAAMEGLIRSAGRTPRQRTTLYADVTKNATQKPAVQSICDREYSPTCNASHG